MCLYLKVSNANYSCSCRVTATLEAARLEMHAAVMLFHSQNEERILVPVRPRAPAKSMTAHTPVRTPTATAPAAAPASALSPVLEDDEALARSPPDSPDSSAASRQGMSLGAPGNATPCADEAVTMDTIRAAHESLPLVTDIPVTHGPHSSQSSPSAPRRRKPSVETVF
jgi:hypothetical protein